ncbi:MAG: hypothetical protein IKR74_00790 [Bacilli bacterium]|nr:hypothetical protein [Bacilli bacterium]
MNSFNVVFPYPIGTYLSKEEDGTVHIDQVNQYIIDAKGISVIVMLDVFTSPRPSTPIELEAFMNNWEELKQTEDLDYLIKR